MKRTAIALATAAILATSVAYAQDKGKAVGAAGYAKVTATVESIDQKTREVTLKGEKGGTYSFVAGPDVKNLAQVSKGDIVTIEYGQALLVGLEKTKSTTREKVVTEGGKTAAPGAMPAAVALRDIAVVASVEAIDNVKHTVTLRGPEQTVTVGVKDAAKLKGVKVGDFVKASYTEAIAIKVEKGPAPAAPAAPAKK